MLGVPGIGLALGPIVSISAAAQAYTGTTATVTVQVGSTSDLYGYALTLTYDPAQLQLQPTAAGPASSVGAIFGAGAVTVINEETQPGRIEISATRSGAAKATAVQGVLARLAFKPLAEGTASVRLAEVQLAGGNAAAIADVTGAGTEAQMTISAPPADNGGGGSNTPPADNGGTTPPADNGGSTPPADNGGSTPPADNGGSTPPADNGGTTPPADNGGSTPPADNGGSTPPADNGGTEPPKPVIDLDKTAEATTATDQSTGRAETTLSLTGDAAVAAVQNAPSDATLRVTAPQESDTTTLATTGSLIQAAADHEARLQIDAPLGSFQIPPGAIDLNALTTALSEKTGSPVDRAKVSIHIVVEKPTAAVAQAASQAAGAKGMTTASAPVEFRVEARSGDQVVPTRSYGKYVTRQVPVTQQVDPATATGAYFDGQTYHHVPTYFDANGKAVLHRNGDSLYVVVQRSRTFSDITNHWAKADIESMASKLIVTGVTEDTFNPSGNVTRAQFAILVARALGLEGEPVPADAPRFTDVPSGSWFESGVRLAANYHLVSGYPDGSFHPDAPITRQELAVMVSRSMDLAGTTSGLSAADAQARIARLADGAGVAGWAQGAVARAMDAGVITGYADGSFLPANQASRAEAVVMIRRFLVAVHFINPAK